MEVIKKEIQWQQFKIRYTLHLRKVKNITLRISEQGELVVVANAFIPQTKIDAFVLEKVQWILKKQQEVRQKQSRLYEDARLQECFYLYDTRLTIVRIKSNRNSVRYDDENLYIYYVKEEDIHKNVIKFIRKMCEQDFSETVKTYYEKLKDYRFPFPTIKFREMKSRWGSCTPSKNQICLNVRMLHYPKAFMEYVVLHELVHFVEPNHGKNFYRVIAYHMRDYKERLKLIK